MAIWGPRGFGRVPGDPFYRFLMVLGGPWGAILAPLASFFDPFFTYVFGAALGHRFVPVFDRFSITFRALFDTGGDAGDRAHAAAIAR